MNNCKSHKLKLAQLFRGISAMLVNGSKGGSPVAAPVRCSWQGIDSLLVASARGQGQSRYQ